MLQYYLTAQLDTLKSYIDERMLAHIRHGQVNKFECFQQLNLISFDWYEIRAIQQKPAQVLIFFTGEHLFFFCGEERTLEKVRRLVGDEPVSNERALFNFFVRLLKDDLEFLEGLEETITETEDALLSSSSRRECAEEIIAFRRTLLRLKKYYEQLNQIFEGLTENEYNLISPENLRYFRILDTKIDRLFAHVLNLRDYVTQVREAYQAQIDIEQNILMRIFTVITSIFLPLTLIVGWYGMNLQMPEFSWPYAYPFVIALSIVVVLLSILFFKRKRWF